MQQMFSINNLNWAIKIILGCEYLLVDIVTIVDDKVDIHLFLWHVIICQADVEISKSHYYTFSLTILSLL